jgi:hypothetical protein
MDHPVSEKVNVMTDMDDDLITLAHQAAEREKATPFREALKIFWPGAMWSMCLFLALVMEGYDVGLVGDLHSFWAARTIRTDMLL